MNLKPIGKIIILILRVVLSMWGRKDDDNKRV